MASEHHLEMVHATVSRMAGQSTTIKGWTVTLVAGLVATGTFLSRPLFAIIAAYVVISMASLDSYYLSLERKYRVLFAEVASASVPEWTMTVSRVRVREMLSAITSPAVSILYGGSLVIVLGSFLATLL